MGSGFPHTFVFCPGAYSSLPHPPTRPRAQWLWVVASHMAHTPPSTLRAPRQECRGFRGLAQCKLGVCPRRLGWGQGTVLHPDSFSSQLGVALSWGLALFLSPPPFFFLLCLCQVSCGLKDPPLKGLFPEFLLGLTPCPSFFRTQFPHLPEVSLPPSPLPTSHHPLRGPLHFVRTPRQAQAQWILLPECSPRIPHTWPQLRLLVPS